MPGNSNADTRISADELKKQLNDSRKNNNAKAVVDLVFQTVYEYVSADLHIQGKTDPFTEGKMDVVHGFLNDLTKTIPKDEKSEIVSENVDFINDLIKETNKRHIETVIKIGRKRDEWVKRIKKGELNDTELIIDEPKVVKGIAHDIVVCSDYESNSAYDAVSTIAEKLYGKNINGSDAGKLFVQVNDEVKAEIAKEQNISAERMKDYSKNFADRNSNSPIGYVVNMNLKNGGPILSEIPEIISNMKKYKTEEDFERREKELQEKIDRKERFDQNIKSSVKVSKVLYSKLSEYNKDIDEQLDDQRFLKQALEKYTHLGTDYVYKKAAPTEAINHINVDDATNDVDLFVSDFHDAVMPIYYKHEDDNTLDTPDGKKAFDNAKLADDIKIFNDSAKKCLEEMQKDNVADAEVRHYKRELYYLNKQRKRMGYFSERTLQDDEYVKSLDEMSEKISDSIANDAVGDKCHEQFIRSLKDQKRLYNKMRSAGADGNVDAYSKYSDLLQKNSEILKKNIKECRDYEGKELICRNMTGKKIDRFEIFENASKAASRIFKKPEPNYDSYIYLHTGNYSGGSMEEMQSNMAKVMAAYSLQKLGKPFNVKQIHKMSEHIKQLYVLGELDNALLPDKQNGKEKFRKMSEIMKNKDTILQEGEKRRREIYEIKGKAYDDYVKDMKTLKESLRKADGRSDEYKGLYNAIKAASELGEKTI